MTQPDWIAVDWGTSNLRVWAMTDDGRELGHRQSNAGMAGLEPGQFEPELLALIGDWLGRAKMPVICCGMAGAKQGWHEAPYRNTPCALLAADRITHVPTKDPRLRVYILPGIKQTQPADVMRGEETQLGGLLSLEPDFDGVVCLPGTHTKWVHISAREIISFATFMTGELFSLLANNSVLHHAVSADGWDRHAFIEAVNLSLSSPAKTSANLFSLRAESLISGLSAVQARSRLSGLLIGLELAGARPYWLGRRVVVLGRGDLVKAYDHALTAQGLSPEPQDGAALSRLGLNAAYQQIVKSKDRP